MVSFDVILIQHHCVETLLAPLERTVYLQNQIKLPFNFLVLEIHLSFFRESHFPSIQAVIRQIWVKSQDDSLVFLLDK